MAAVDASTVPLLPGNVPDLPPRARVRARRGRPLDLPRLVMRPALVVALGFLLLSLALGLLAARSDTRAEIAGALALARMDQRLDALPADDTAALAALGRIGPLRHVELRVADSAGRVLLDTAPPPAAAPLRWLMLALNSSGTSVGQSVSWPIGRPDGSAWTATLTASPESEQREALANLLGLFGLLAACSALMLVVMRWHVRRAFRPLDALLAAIAGIERNELGGVKALPPMPVRELDATAAALRRLADSLEQAEDARRVLAHKVLTLQEDERQRLARDLHDEFGQRLTALRADAAWLRRRVAADAGADAVASGMGEQIARIQQDVRGLLARLRPLEGTDAGTESTARLLGLLAELAASWSRGGDGGLRCEAVVRRAADDGGNEPLEDLPLPRALVLTLYRISQEAFTNAARHAGATQARVAVEIRRAATGELVLDWSAADDGRGLPQPESAFARGNGLAGIRERVWALDGEFQWVASNPPPMTGLNLHARIVCRASEGLAAAS
jgi:two-component system sensor histidine kinase UhpB